MTLSQWLWLVVLSVLWGGSFLFVGIAVKEMPPFTLVLARVALAAAVLLPIVLVMGERLPATLAGWWPFWVMAVLNNVIPFTLIVSGQREIASGLASVLNATTPVWAVLIAWALAGERPSLNRGAGVVVGIAGVAVLVGPDAFAGNRSSALGMALCLGGAISYGFSGLWGRRLKAHPPLVTALAQLVCSSVMLAPVALVVERPWTLAMPGAATLWAIGGLAVLSTAAAYIVFFHIMRVSGPLNAMLVTILIPVSAIALGAIVLHEALAARQFWGAAVIGLALLAIDGRPTTWLAARLKPAMRK
ncbi:MAG: DMT family transporter [Hyphomicrobiaceae bacterium]